MKKNKVQRTASTKEAMAQQYVEVTLDDMEKFLKRSFHVLRPKQSINRGEVCYDLTVSKNVGIRVWTSIHRGRDQGAKLGQDSIKVGLISVAKLGAPLTGGKLPIVKRTQNWRTNLGDLIEDAMEMYEEKPEYWDARPQHGAAAVEKEDRFIEDEKTEEESARDEDGEGDGPDEPEYRSKHLRAIGNWSKLPNGAWGIAVADADAQPGDTLMVQRQNGTSSKATLGKPMGRGYGGKLLFEADTGRARYANTQDELCAYVDRLRNK